MAYALIYNRDHDERVYAADLMTSLGYKPYTAQDEAVFFDALSRLDPKIVIVDLDHDAHGAGAKIIAAVRARPLTVDAPVIATSVHDDGDTLTVAMIAGASAFMPKPYTARDLKSQIKHATRRLAP